MAARIDIYQGRAPEDLPAYALPRAAGILRLSPSTLRLWATGGDGSALFKAARRSPLSLSFSNLIEAFVLASMRRVHGVSMQRVRKALRYVGKELGYDRPLVHAGFQTDGVELFVVHAGRLLAVSAEGQTVLREALDTSLTRIEWQGDFAARLYPWVRGTPDPRQPKTVVVDPRLGFGQPVMAGTGIETRVVVSRYRAGESAAVLAEDYGVDIERIDDAIRCEVGEAA
ncbi:MAG: DUF433 domain-containing protein [Myxococcales bacterium]|nr:DUF433 domain-containing protein [Myxococcales bacterium]